MPVIIVTGTPGTGKTTVAKHVGKVLKLKYVDVNMLIKEKDLATGYDKKRNCAIIKDFSIKVFADFFWRVATLLEAALQDFQVTSRDDAEICIFCRKQMAHEGVNDAYF